MSQLQNYYQILDISKDSTKKEIVSAYRKKALQYHPDKNIEKDTSEIFLLISKALEILTDDAARLAFDRVLKAKEAYELRNKSLDERRKKFKSTLESREKFFESKAQENAHLQKSAEEMLKAEIERIRKEGSTLRAEEERRMKEQISKAFTPKGFKYSNSTSSHTHIFKLRWDKFEVDDLADSHHVLLKELLHHVIKNKLGLPNGPEVSNIIHSQKNPSTALVELLGLNPNHCETFVNHIENLQNTPSEQKFVCRFKNVKIKLVKSFTNEPLFNDLHSHVNMDPIKQTKSAPQEEESFYHENQNAEIDFETLVLCKMREAESRKKQNSNSS